MRLLSAAAVLLLISACSSTPGSGGTGGTAPATQDAAWTVNVAGDGTSADDCPLAATIGEVGEVTETTIVVRELDGSMGAQVDCSVTGAGPYAVKATASKNAYSLEILIPSITAAASATSPASGSVYYQSGGTIALYSSPSCDFWFSQSEQGVDPGQIWVNFSCATLSDSSTQSTCSLPASNPSIALFENCSTL
jgi:hypothetical protein